MVDEKDKKKNNEDSFEFGGHWITSETLWVGFGCIVPFLAFP